MKIPVIPLSFVFGVAYMMVAASFDNNFIIAFSIERIEKLRLSSSITEV